MDPSRITIHEGGAVIYTGDATRLFQAKAIRAGLRACKIGMRVNRAYTPSACLRTAGNIVGKTFKRGQYDEAIVALDEWINACVASMPVENMS